MTNESERDRDMAGRPFNARPRDELGRPLDYGEVGVEPLPEVLDLSPGESLEMAQELLDEGRPFMAHEVLESAWKSAPPDERDLWQGLAQIAVAVTHAKRGNVAGAVTLLERALSKLSPYAADPPYLIDVVGLIAWCLMEVRELSAPDSTVQAPRLRRSSSSNEDGASE